MATSTSRGDESPRAADLVLPSYPEMIVEAIASLAEENGSSQAAIARRIEAARGAAGGLPPSHPALVAAHLSRMSAAGELVAVAGGKYALRPPPPLPPVLPDAAAEFPTDDESEDDLPPSPPPPPPKRGRGRPPKVRSPGYPGLPAAVSAPVVAPGDGLPAAAAAPAVPRRRGRPPKPRDPHAPPKIPRPRGRPRKNPLPDGMVLPPPRPGAAAKPRPQFAEVGFV
ncbi:HMG-Y-related protein A-like [Oryza brachyantha]|uniref:HMG-Y-related protein A-like n=1 Tax=Oryza brachyantha TaxID=4533 RepID=UPI001ADAEF31|nr:HMG-Y-related protein A-like [Oryza brachyantha]